MADTPAKDLAYYLTLFKVEGHTTWRAHLGQDKDAFQHDKEKNWGKKGPVVTDIMVMRIDRITGTFQPQ